MSRCGAGKLFDVRVQPVNRGALCMTNRAPARIARSRGPTWSMDNWAASGLPARATAHDAWVLRDPPAGFPVSGRFGALDHFFGDECPSKHRGAGSVRREWGLRRALLWVMRGQTHDDWVARGFAGTLESARAGRRSRDSTVYGTRSDRALDILHDRRRRGAAARLHRRWRQAWDVLRGITLSLWGTRFLPRLRGSAGLAGEATLPASINT